MRLIVDFLTNSRQFSTMFIFEAIKSRFSKMKILKQKTYNQTLIQNLKINNDEISRDDNFVEEFFSFFNEFIILLH